MLLIIILGLLLGETWCQDPTIVTKSGAVRGLQGESKRDGTKYAAFLGIPYAEPPVGDLRFQAPVPIKPWTETKNATQFGKQCYANTNGPDQDEDCLFLNVFTPLTAIPPSNESKAVMVFVHGGAFMAGSSNGYAPDWFIDHDVVFVSFNYRLGAFGFLSLNTLEVPGNAGLKDMVSALKWVKDNIEAFGGNPEKITIFGESSGSGSVSLLQLSGLAKGLFNGIIMESGTGVNNWAVQPRELAQEHALKFGYFFSCNIDDLHELFECLKEVQAEHMAFSQHQAIVEDDFAHIRMTVFTPCLEPEATDAFLTRPPFEILADGDYIKVPVILGSNTRESIFQLPMLELIDPTGIITETVGRNMTNFIPEDLLVSLNETERKEVGQHLKDYYVGGEFTLENRIKLLDMKTDLDFVLDIQRLALILRESSDQNVYNYRFSFDGAFNAFKALNNLSTIQGAIHGDELGYLFNLEFLSSQYETHDRNTTEQTVVDKMLLLWTNFAKTGDPTPDIDDVITTKWSPVTPEASNYLDINDQLTLKQGLDSERIKLWNDLYEKYQNRRPFLE